MTTDQAKPTALLPERIWLHVDLQGELIWVQNEQVGFIEYTRAHSPAQAENVKFRQVLGWILDAADAAYNEDSTNIRIHEIFNIVAEATGITRRLPDEYQRFDESSPA